MTSASFRAADEMNVNMSLDSIPGLSVSAAAAEDGAEREFVFCNKAADDSSLHMEDRSPPEYPQSSFLH